MHAVDDAPEIDADDVLPALVMVERSAARPGAGIVHEDRDLAEGGVDLFLEAAHVLDAADVAGDRDQVGRIAADFLCDRGLGDL